jgi:hypothetical protein
MSNFIRENTFKWQLTTNPFYEENIVVTGKVGGSSGRGGATYLSFSADRVKSGEPLDHMAGIVLYGHDHRTVDWLAAETITGRAARDAVWGLFWRNVILDPQADPFIEWINYDWLNEVVADARVDNPATV